MIEIYTDGSCLKNPGGRGTCAYVIIENNKLLHQKAYRKDSTTNNRMEISAILMSMLFIKEKGLIGRITIYSDSQYAVKGITEWMHGWKKKNWRKKGEDIPNRDLWEKVYEAYSAVGEVTVKWVRGHANSEWNIYTDKLCEEAYQ